MDTKLVLYRNDEYDNSAGIIRNIADIIYYEIDELGNTDILEYCNAHYQLSEELTNDIDDIIEQVENDDNIKPSYLKYIIDKLIKEISEEAGKRLRFGLWLADKQIVMNFYDGNEDNITAYQTSDVILSDLGEDGKLFAYDIFPVPLN